MPLMAIMARVTFFSLCFVASDIIAEGSAIAPQVSELSRQKSFSSIIQQSRQESEIALPGVAGKRVGSGFKILKSPSASGLHKLCSDIDVNGSTLDAGDPRQPEPTLLDLHSGEHVENVQDPCEQQSPKHPDAHRPEAACLPKNLLKPLIKVCESQLPAPVVLRCSYNSWARAKPNATFALAIPPRPLLPPADCASPSPQWTSAARRWVGGVPTIFELDGHGRLTVEGDDPFHQPPAPSAPPLCEGKAAAAAAADGGLEPVSDDDGDACASGTGGGLRLRDAATATTAERRPEAATGFRAGAARSAVCFPAAPRRCFKRMRAREQLAAPTVRSIGRTLPHIGPPLPPSQ